MVGDWEECNIGSNWTGYVYVRRVSGGLQIRGRVQARTEQSSGSRMFQGPPAYAMSREYRDAVYTTSGIRAIGSGYGASGRCVELLAGSANSWVDTNVYVPAYFYS